ncbi:transcriptional regulator, MarR family [Gottschalkia purinilytica]|uniref:Transcriptional regulator, MarR family n=1 Tax=Gottschalkia purinilytica TaxID=1503 RepID=A0A0L0W7T8_GOTPU|nr:MarR family transcriptional regulator [Gottschalkia purinilytica]KNF07609.1 transcriptional regulator, MarR family [Gottschalkia purinilytica]
MEEISKGIRIIKILKKVMGTIKQSMRHECHGMQLTGPQGMLIGILSHNKEKMKVSDLSENLGLSNSTVSGIIDRLEKQGLVERTRSKDDRRVVYVSVTDEVRKKHKQHFNEIEKRFEDIMSKGTPEEIDKILEGLYTLEKVIDRQRK